MSDAAISNTITGPRSNKRFPVDIDLYQEFSPTIDVSNVSFPVGDYTRYNVEALNRRSIEILETIREKVERLGEDVRRPLPEGPALLKDLRGVGADAAGLLGDSIREEINSIEQSEKERSISLDFTFPADMSFLWELIYADDPFKPEVNPTAFWGYRYPIGRLFKNIRKNDLVRLRKGVFASSHNDLVHSDGELLHLQQKIQKLGLLLKLDLYFHTLKEHSVPVTAIDDSWIFEFFSDHAFDYGLVHFACHCVQPGEYIADSSQAYLLFSSCQQDLKIIVSQLKTAAAYKRAKYGFQGRPLIFLNACASATPKYLQSLKLPNVLMQFGAGSVIATSCIIPDAFGSAFADEFYTRLFGKYISNAEAALNTGTPEALEIVKEQHEYISEALLETRWHFWDTYQNPLGLAYGLYAQADQLFKIL